MKRNMNDFTSQLRRTRPLVPMVGVASALLFTASLALAQSSPPTSPGCDAVNAGAWDVAVVADFTNGNSVESLAFS